MSMAVNDAIIERFRKLFGEDYLGRRKEEGFTNYIPYRYRDRGTFYKHYGDPNDEQIIKDHLEGLTFDELNAIDENRISLLHLAINYNRAGQNGRGFWYNKKDSCENRNIVWWLLENDSFYQKGVQGTHGIYFDGNCKHGTALHLAFCAKIQRPRLEFFSENHGGKFGNDFVACEAIESLLDNEAWARANINSLNKDGLSALDLAVKMAALRCRVAGNIVFRDGSRFGQKIDISISTYESDYPTGIGKLMKSPFIRIHNTFGLNVSALNDEKFVIPKQLDHNKKLSLDWSMPPGMKALHDLSESAYKDQDHVNGWMVEQLLGILLTEDSGNLKDALKAQSLAIAIYSRYDYCEVRWMFNPRALNKKAGGALRKLFVRHAASALYSVDRYVQVLHQEFGRYSLRDVGEELSRKYNLATPLWSKILANVRTQDSVYCVGSNF